MELMPAHLAKVSLGHHPGISPFSCSLLPNPVAAPRGADAHSLLPASSFLGGRSGQSKQDAGALGSEWFVWGDLSAGPLGGAGHCTQCSKLESAVRRARLGPQNLGTLTGHLNSVNIDLGGGPSNCTILLSSKSRAHPWSTHQGSTNDTGQSVVPSLITSMINSMDLWIRSPSMHTSTSTARIALIRTGHPYHLEEGQFMPSQTAQR